MTEYNKGKYKHLILSQAEVDSIKAAIDVLKPFQLVSDNLSSERHVTASAIIPILKQTSNLNEKCDEDETE